MNPLAHNLLEGDIPDPDAPSVAPARSALTSEDYKELAGMVVEQLECWMEDGPCGDAANVEEALVLYDSESLVRLLVKLDPAAAARFRITFGDVFQYYLPPA
jgi:hypothetical protein